jgi:excisionase family DNA binding protein
MKEFLSIKEACKDFGISKNSIYKLINSGTIKKYQLGELAKRTFVMKEEIIAAFKVKE